MNRQQYHTLHDSLEYLRTDLIDIHRQLRFFYDMTFDDKPVDRILQVNMSDFNQVLFLIMKDVQNTVDKTDIIQKHVNQIFHSSDVEM